MPPLTQARPSNPMQSSLASHEWLRTRRLDACPKREATVDRHTADGMERRLSRGEQLREQTGDVAGLPDRLIG